MNLLAALKNINRSVSRIDEIPLGTESLTVGWNSYIYDSNNVAIAGGTNEDRMIARRICVAEAFERALFQKICGDSLLRDEFHIDEFPTSSGFAAGFDSKSTRMRAICEGLERWAWSKWIDDGFLLDSAEPKTTSSLSGFLLKSFNSHKCYRRTFTISVDENPLVLQFGVFVGLTEHGAFAGSRICNINENPWDHAIIEAHRNYQNSEYFKVNGLAEFQKDNIIAIRANFFATNKMSALSQIDNAKRVDWPEPELLFVKEFITTVPEVFLYRCLFKNFIGWHLGDFQRFVY